MPPAHRNLYAAIREQRWRDAEAMLTRLLTQPAHATDASLLTAMDHVQAALGRRERSAHFAVAAWGASRPAPELAKRALRTLSEVGDWKHAAEVSLDAVADSPMDVQLRVMAAQSCMMGKRFVDAEAVLRPAAQDPACPPWIIHEHLARLFALGEADACAALGGRALERFPEDSHIARIVAACMNYTIAPREAIFRAHQRHGALVKPAADVMTPGQLMALRGARSKDQPLRIGLLSSEFCLGPVARFTTALVGELARGAAEVRGEPVALWMYHLGRANDATTAFFRARAHTWRDCAALSDAELVTVIRADALDVIVDLAGLSRGARPSVLASRVAPLQVTSVGYPHTTGIATMDLRIVDGLTDPPGAELFATERLARLEPCFACFDPTTITTPATAPHPTPSATPDDPPRITCSASTPPVSPCPALSKGHITFGSFNSLAKLSGETLGSWARILAGVPTSRLLIKNYECQDPKVRESIWLRLEALGVARSRVELVPFTDTIDAHLAAYARVDVALDTFPYHGTTTTCEALWMGVPVVVRVGDTHASRVGLSILTNVSSGRGSSGDDAPHRDRVDLRDLVTHSADDYVRVAVALAHDAPRLERLRASLRDAMATSALCDARGYAQRWIAAIRKAMAV